MPEHLEIAMARLQRAFPDGFDHSIRFEIGGAGSIILDRSGVREGAGETECTVRASAATLEKILEGQSNPVQMYLIGKITIEGDPGIAVKFGKSMS